MINWIDEAGRSLGFQVETERRQKTHGKIFQIDSTWFKDSKFVAFVEAERRWDINHIIGHLVCCADFASQERISLILYWFFSKMLQTIQIGLTTFGDG